MNLLKPGASGSCVKAVSAASSSSRRQAASNLLPASATHCRSTRSAVGRRGRLLAVAESQVDDIWEAAPPAGPPRSLQRRPGAYDRTAGKSLQKVFWTRNRRTAAVAAAMAVGLLLYSTRDAVTPLRAVLAERLNGPLVTKFEDGDVLVRGVAGNVFYSTDSDGNLLSLQPDGQLYIERLGGDGRLEAAYLVGNIRDVPDAPARDVQRVVDAELEKQQQQ